MPTERDAANPASPPKLDMLRLEDRLNPVGALTADALLSFAPNPVLDFGTATPAGTESVAPSVAAPATVAPADPVLAPNQYELVLPTTTDGSPSTDSSGGAFALFSVVPPPPAATLSGFVYVDEGENGGTRDDGIKQAGEPGIPGTTVSLFRVINGVTIPAGQTLTDANGFYQFPSLSPFGEYQVVESNQPAGFLDGKDTAGTVNGTTRGVATNERINGITLNALDAGVNYNFGELRAVQPTGALSGYVYEDEGANGGTRDDGIRQSGETPIPGATVTLFRIVNGQTVSVSQTTTDANGFYRFANLPAAGGYIVRETQPANYTDGKDTPGSTGGTNSANDELSAVTVPANGESFNNNFGELIQRGALSGFVYVDEGANGGTRDDGIKQAGEAVIPGTTVTLFRLVNGQTVSVSQTTTDPTGFYRFANLVAGAGYIVRETQPAGFNDGKDTPGSTGGTNTANDELSAVTVPVNGESFNNNFGELFVPVQPAQLSGFVYVDSDDDGVKDNGEAAIPGTTVVLFQVVGGNTTSLSQTTTDGNGFYAFTNLTPGTYEVRETQPANFNDGKDTPGSTGGTAPQNDRLISIPLAAGANSQNNNFGELVQTGALSGFVYVDEGAGGGTRDDGIKQPGETPIPGTTVTLFRVVGGQTTSVSQTTTDANGFYRFANLTPGAGYIVRETQPASFNDGKDTPGTTGGTNSANDELSAISVPANGESFNNNFGELIPPVPPAQLSGFVYEDDDNDGVKDAGEAAIPGTTVTLFRVVNGNTTSVGQTTTDGNGFYSFTALEPGTYEVRETQPATYLDGKDTAGSKGGSVTNDRIAVIPLVSGDNSVNNNFGELRPARLSGFEYVDEGANGGTRDDGIKQPGEPGIPGTTVVLTGTDDLGGVTRTATTAADGSYAFDSLRPGTYTVNASQPAAFNDGKDTAGSKGGTVTNDQIAAIPIVVGDNSVNNNFGELLQQGTLSGFVYVDPNDNGVKENGEAAIPGTTVTLFRVVGGQTTSLSQTTTDASGFYQFANLTPGDGYIVRETQPAGFNDGKDTPGSTGGTNSANDELSAITVPVNGASINNNFGELVQTGALSGFVYVDEGAGGGTRDDGVKDAGEAPIPGTTVTLFRVVNGNTTSLSQTTTAANGFYRFANLTPGGGYIVRETQPAGFNDGKDTPGSTGGTNTANDELSAISVPVNGESFNNNFGELFVPVQPAQLSGFVYVDGDDDGVKDNGEAPIPGTTVVLFQVVGGNTTSLSQTTTDGNGFYAFTNLTPGTYEVRETQPAAFNDGKDTPGSTGGTAPQNDRLISIPLAAGANSQNNNFGELVQTGALSGFVYVDEGAGGGTRDDGIKQPGETPIPGTTVTLFRVVNGQTTSVSQTTTDANGFYRFANLTPGAGYIVRESQPAAFTDGKDTPGTTGGVNSANDELSAVSVPANGESFNNNFGELVPPPVPAQLSGFVYVDADNDGVKDAGEAAIPGATVTLFRVVNGATTSVGQTTTDGNGAYTFGNLAAGTYVVRETQPAGFDDGKDTPGSKGGDAGTNDQIAVIPLLPGDNSVNNNFGELARAQLSGFVYVDTNNNGIKEPGEAGIPGTVVRVGGTTVGGVPTGILETTTDANGFYSFPNLPAGTYGVQEVQPSAFLDGKDTPGSTGGGAPQNDTLTTVTLPSGANSVNNNFGELVPPVPPAPAQLSGFVYQDANDNGVRELGEVHIAGATVTLFRVVNGTTTSVGQTTTDGTGAYTFGNLEAGTYEVRESQPAGFTDGKDTPGSKGGDASTNDRIAVIPLVAGDNSVNNNFGELLPPPVVQPGSVNGFVYVDADDDGVKDAGEAAIPGTVVRLTNGTTTLTTTTDGNGFYQFTNLTPGQYTLVQTQPADYLDGQDTPGSTGGNNSVNDVLSVVTVPAGGVSTNNNFGELQKVSLYGYVWYDANENARFDPVEMGLGGATVTLTGTTASGRPITTALTGGNPLSVTTDSFGRYNFPCLPAGTYSVVQSNTPVGFNDFREENAARLTVGSSSPTQFIGTVLNRDAGPLNFGKVNPSIVVDPPVPNPQLPDPNNPSKQNFLGSTSTGVTVPPTTPGRQLPVSEAGPFNPSVLGPTGTGNTRRIYAVGAGAGSAPVVRVFDAATGGELFRLNAYDPAFLGGVTTAIGDINADGFDDIITGAGAGGGPHVKVFDGQTGALLQSYFAYDSRFTGGVWLASGDVNDDGWDDVVVGAGAGGGAHVKSFSGRNGELMHSFFAFDLSNTAGARVAVGDFNGDGYDDIAAATGAGVASQVATFDGRNLNVLSRVAPYAPAFLGGVNLAAGDVNGDGRAELITGAGQGGGPHVRALNATTGAAVHDFFATSTTFTGGVSVAARDLNADGLADIVTGSGPGAQARIQVFSGANLATLDNFFAFESTNTGGVFVG